MPRYVIFVFRDLIFGQKSSQICQLLPSQSCRLGVNSCQLRGCSEAKLVLLHIKTCPATAGRECPANHNGCTQARKLLAHYDTCREIRIRKPAGDHHVCLVCSLVARHARIVLNGDNNNGISHQSNTAAAAAANGSSGVRRARFASYDDESSNNTTTKVAPVAPAGDGAPPATITPGIEAVMPPPPPRNPLIAAKATVSAAIELSSTSVLSATTATSSLALVPALCESPPVLAMGSPLFSVAAAASLAQPIPKSEPDTISTNTDNANSSQAVSWSSSLSNSSNGLFQDGPSEESARPRRRKRAETLDFSAFSAAQPLLALRSSSSLPRQFGDHIHLHRHPSIHNDRDPTLEHGLSRDDPETPYDAGYESDPNLSLSSSLIKRPRSLSCSVMMGRSSHLKGSCETIVEEASLSSKESLPNNAPVPEHEEAFYMDEDTPQG